MNPARTFVEKLATMAMLSFEAVMRFGFASAAVFAVVLGRFALGAVLGLIALGLFLRFWRLRRLARRRGAP